MIVQIRGTSGSGKSTVVTNVMKRFRSVGQKFEPVYTLPEIEHFAKPRKIPLYYRCKRPATGDVIILGNYDENGSGGCDTIGKESSHRSSPAIFNLLKTINGVFPKCHILCEGLLLSEDVKWTSQIDWSPVVVVFLNTSVETCIKQVQSRREKQGKVPEFNTDNTTKRAPVIERAKDKLSLVKEIEIKELSALAAASLVFRYLKNGRRESFGDFKYKKG